MKVVSRTWSPGIKSDDYDDYDDRWPERPGYTAFYMMMIAPNGTPSCKIYNLLKKIEFLNG